MKWLGLFRKKSPKKPELLQNAAVLLLSLPASVSSSILNRLDRPELEAIGPEMKRLEANAEGLKEQTIHQFWGILVEHGKLSPASQPGIPAIQQIILAHPDDAAALLKRYWLVNDTGETNRVAVQEDKNQVSKFYHFPQKLVKSLFSMISDEDIGAVAEELFQTFTVPGGRNRRLIPQDNSEMGQSIKDFLQLLPGSYNVTQRVDFEIQEKVAILLLLLKPKQASVIAGKLLGRLNRANLESLILAFLQIQEISDKGKTDVLRDFLSFFNASFVASAFDDESRLLEEIERMTDSMPGQIARCLRQRWLIEKVPQNEWEELSQKNPELASQKLADYFNDAKPGLWRHFTNWEKAAIFLQTIDPKCKKKILNEMGPEESDLLSSQMKRAWSISAGEKRSILQEFLGDYYFLSTTKLLENQEL